MWGSVSTFSVFVFSFCNVASGVAFRAGDVGNWSTVMDEAERILRNDCGAPCLEVSLTESLTECVRNMFVNARSCEI